MVIRSVCTLLASCVLASSLCAESLATFQSVRTNDSLLAHVAAGDTVTLASESDNDGPSIGILEAQIADQMLFDLTPNQLVSMLGEPAGRSSDGELLYYSTRGLVFLCSPAPASRCTGVYIHLRDGPLGFDDVHMKAFRGELRPRVDTTWTRARILREFKAFDPEDTFDAAEVHRLLDQMSDEEAQGLSTIGTEHILKGYHEVLVPTGWGDVFIGYGVEQPHQVQVVKVLKRPWEGP